MRTSWMVDRQGRRMLTGQAQRSGRHHPDTPCSPGARLPPNHNLDILVERRQQVHQAFHREPRKLVVTECGDLRLRHSQHFGGFGLRQLALFEHLIQRIRQAQFCLPLGGIRIPEVRKRRSWCRE
jgi:hypothetical protein